jgi:hypothetical protein
MTGVEAATLQTFFFAAPTSNVIITGLQYAWSMQRDIYVQRGDYPLPSEAVGARQRGLERLARPDVAADIMYPDDMWAITDWPVPLYPAQLLGLDTMGGEQLFSAASEGANRRPYSLQVPSFGKLEIDPARCGAIIEFHSVSKDRSRYPAHKDVTLHKAALSALSGKSPVCLLFGDSLIDHSGVVSRLYEMLTGNGASPTFLGTLLAQDVFVAGITARPSEGRGGKNFRQFLNIDIPPDPDSAMTVPASTAAYNAATDADKHNLNPFLRAATGGETSSAPAYVANGYVFDLGFYLSRFGYSTPDFIVFNSMSNDIAFAFGAAAGAVAVQDGITVMVSRIRVDAPNAQIVFTFQATGYAGPDAGLADFEGYAVVIRAAMETIAGLGDSKVHLLPIYAHQSRITRWGGSTEITAETESTPQIVEMTDTTHYQGIASDQAAETMLRFIANHV